jgi:hypothetical protein
MREDAVVLFHDVETYLEQSELGGCYFYTGWTGKKRVNYCISNGEICGTEHMGILDIERRPQEIYADLIQIARQPITGSKFQYCAKEDPLGIEWEDLDITLRHYMERYYPEGFVTEIMDVLLENFKEYKNKWIYYKHQNRIMDSSRFQNCLGESALDKNNRQLETDGKVAIWGAGTQGTKFVRNILAMNEADKIAAWVDSKKKNGLVAEPETLKTCSFEYLIIAVEARGMFENIKSQAIQLGVPEENIKWLFE